MQIMGRQGCFQDTPFPRLWVSGFLLIATQMWVHTTVHSHLIYHILNSQLAHVKGRGGEWCLKGPPGATHLESKHSC